MSEITEKPRFDDYGKSVVREIRPYLFNSYPYIITGFRLNDNEKPMEGIQTYEISIKCTKCEFEWNFSMIKSSGSNSNPFYDGMTITKIFYEKHYTHVE